jgi:molybdopterin-guanine dinucleotide biosynthesis protein A
VAKASPPRATPANTLCVVLAGGQGRRMDGADKGLQIYQGRPLIDHMLERLRGQSWGPALHIGISANRHLDTYATKGYPVWTDAQTGYEGPLQGLLSALQQARTGPAALHYLLIVPCDTPHLPLDLAQRLSEGLDATHTHVAAARAGGRTHPLACLLSIGLMPALQHYLGSGQRKVQTWMEACGVQWVDFDGPGDAPGAFGNFNTQADLQAGPGG